MEDLRLLPSLYTVNVWKLPVVKFDILLNNK